jgi:photosystem II stability/assembly factor-like uncharacterized protein
LYRSPDKGRTWENTFASFAQPLTATAVISIEKIVFAGVNGAVLRSDNAGETWHMAGLASPPPQVVTLAASPNFRDDGIIVAGTADDGIFVSDDGGMNWTAWNFGLLDYHIFALAFAPNFTRDRTIFAGTESGIFRSQNGGRGWSELSFPFLAAPVLSLAVSESFDKDGRLYAGTESHGLFTSDDAGLNWQQEDDTSFDTAVNTVWLSAPPSHELWLLLEDRLLCSVDHGQSWERRYDFQSEKIATAMLVAAGSPPGIIIGFADGDIQQIF